VDTLKDPTAKHVVVTGTSTGIGYAAAAELVRCGFHVFGGVRSDGDAERVRSELGAMLTPLRFDVTDGAAVRAAADRVAEAVGGGNLAGLVNNAGIAVAGPLMHVPIDEVRRQFEVNVLGVLRVTRALLPLLGTRHGAPSPRGRIVNVSSTSGRISLPFEGPYAASKHALECLSDTLRRELLPYKIDVIVVAPGAVRTAIWDKLPDASLYRDTDYAAVLKRQAKAAQGRRDQAMPPAVVARAIRRALTVRRPRTRYVLPASRWTRWILPRWIPDRWFDRLIARRFGWR